MRTTLASFTVLALIAVASVALAPRTSVVAQSTPSPLVEVQDWKVGDMLTGMAGGALYGPSIVSSAKGTSGLLVVNSSSPGGGAILATYLTVYNAGDCTISVTQATNTVVIPPKQSTGIAVQNGSSGGGQLTWVMSTDGAPSVANGRFVWVLR